MEHYVVQLPLYKRQNFTKLRISAHRLAIETGRHSRPVIPAVNRVCTLCNDGSIEDEIHVVINCPAYQQQREILQNNILTYSSLVLEPTEHIFKLIMSCCYGDLEYAVSICKFVDECFRKRENCLNQEKI